MAVAVMAAAITSIIAAVYTGAYQAIKHPESNSMYTLTHTCIRYYNRAHKIALNYTHTHTPSLVNGQWAAILESNLIIRQPSKLHAT